MVSHLAMPMALCLSLPILLGFPRISYRPEDNKPPYVGNHYR